MAYSEPDTYWADRQVKQQDKITDRTIEDTNKALAKYYENAAKSIIREFESTYNHILARQKEGQVTPADLYNLSRYWEMLAQVEREANKLGDKVVSTMTEEFTSQWQEIYENTAVPSDDSFSTISRANAEVMVNKPWLADGKSFSERVYGNVSYLLDTLEEELVSCVVTGKSSSELKMKLMERFNISYRQAETLVRTETNHIQTEAARQAYEDAGVKQYMYLGREEHDIGCNCKKYDRKIFNMADAKTGVNLPPLHPNCRCTIKAIVDDEMIKEISMKKQQKNKQLEQDMQALIEEIEELKTHGWADWDDKIDEIKALPPEKQKNWLGRCEKCGRAYVKKSDKSHKQKYCEFCQADIEHDRNWDKNLDAMLKVRIAKGMTYDEAWRDIEDFRDRKEDGETNQKYIKKGRKTAKKAVVSSSIITKHCHNCGKRMSLKYSESDRLYCDECDKKIHPKKGTTVTPDNYGQHCNNCGKKLSRRDKERKNHPELHMCAQCQKKILESDYGKHHKSRGFSEWEILRGYKNTDNPLEFKLKTPSMSLKDGWLNQEKKYSKPSQKLINSVAHLTDADFGFCIDCNKYYIKENRKATRQMRCPECQEKYDKEYKKAKAQEYRDKAKQEKIAAQLAAEIEKAKEEAKEATRARKAAWARKNRANKKAMKS